MTLIKNWMYCPILVFVYLIIFSKNLNAQKPTNTSLTSELPTIEWAVQIKSDESIEEVAAALNAEVVGPIGSLKNYYLLRIQNSINNAITVEGTFEKDNKIIWSEQQTARQMSKKNWNDPRIGDQWHLNNTGQRGGTAGVDANVFPAWNLGVSGDGVQICIVDDGLEKDHDDLSANFVLADSRDLNGNNGNDPSPTSNADDHGTACAGVAAAIGNNNTGVSGVAYDANLSGVRLIAAANTPADEVTALTLSPNNNHIYSNSWGPTDNGTYNALNSLVKAALLDGANNGRNGLGSIYTWAAGNGRTANDNTNYDGYVNSIHTIGVGAHGDNGIFSWYSEPGASMLISAPSNGGNAGITTTTVNDGYTNDFGGTSSATPLVSGLIALMLEANPNLTWRDVQHILVESATAIDAGNADWTQNGAGKAINHAYGFGGVDAAALVVNAQNWNNVADVIADTSAVVTVNIAIPDGAGNEVYGAAVQAMTNVVADITVEHVELKINITHPYRGDLRVKLVSPQGTESILSVAHNESGDDLDDWYFMTVRNWGENSQGNWTVIVDDGGAADLGTFVDFQLIIHGTPNEDCVDNQVLNNQTVAQNTYKAAQSINSNGTIAMNTTVTFQAGTEIVLTDGFHAVSNSTFNAKIAACTANLVNNLDRSRIVQPTELPSLVTKKEQANLTIYPNPITYQSNLSLNLPQSQTVSIYLMDALGKQIGQLQPTTLFNQGQHDLLLDLDKFQLNNGIYFVVTKIDNQTIAKKISLLR